MSNGDDNLTDHEYDGIQEFDNPLPAWWLVTFFLTIIFGAIYWMHYASGTGETQIAELERKINEMKLVTESGQATSPKDAPETEEQLAAQMGDADVLSLGAEVFKGKCAVCHGEHLQGLIGPNLVDNFWLHGKGSMADLIQVINNGVVEKGMPAWSAMLKPNEVKAVAIYMNSLKGSSPENPKAPQGVKID